MAKIWKPFSMFVILVILIGVVPAIFPASPVQADLSSITVTPRDSQIVGLSTGYDIQMTVGAAGGLAPGDTVTVEFPIGTTVPTSISTGQVFVKTVAAQAVSVSARQVTVTLASGCLVAHNEAFTLTFALGAGLKNPTTPGADKTVVAWTNRETLHVTSNNYTIGGVEVKRGGVWVATYVTIQAAIDNAGTLDGDTVLIYSATFTENVNVNKELTLQGTGATVPVIDGGAGGTTVTVADSNVTLTGLTIQNGPTGVAVTSGTGNKINNCNIITNTTYGLYNTSGTAVDATSNWWDSTNGPEHSGNTFNVGSQGDIVSDSVGYVRWLNAAYPSGTSFAPVTKNSATTYYSSIQAAITAAATGDIITCQAGTFTEDLNVITDNLTLKSASGRDSTIIQLKTGADNAGIGIQGTASNFKLGGAANQGFNIKGGTGVDMRNIQLVNAPSGVTISHNTIDTTGSAAQGISVGAAGATGLTVSNNNFIAATISGAGEISIWGPDVVNVNVSNNQFTGPGSTTITSAVNIAGATSATTSTISGNTISGYGSGIFIYSGVAPDSGTTVVDNVTISDNTISDCGKGIRLGHSSNTLEMTRVTAENNTLSTNTIGLYVANAASIKADQFTIRHNNFSGNNVTYGLQNANATYGVTAQDNWWGSANGPEHSGNTFNVGSQGDIVSDSVGYVRWLNAAYPSGTSFAPVTKNSATTYYSSIQAAITAAATGDIITCQAGTFTEDLNVITDNLTLKSASGRDSTIIQLKTGADNAGIGIQGTASNFKLGGAANQGFNIKGGTGVDMRNIQLVNAPSGVTISHNTIDTTGSAAQGISVGAAGATGLTVSNNNFIAATISGAGEISIWGPDVVNVNVSNNQFTGPGSTTITSAVNIAGATSATTSTISGNTISGYGSGIFIYSGVAPDSGTTVVDNVTISGNTISGCTKGIRLGHSSNTLEMTRVTAENNTLSTNTVGLFVDNAASIKADQFTIRHNNFSGNNVTSGLQNANATYGVTAKYNFWGHAFGPSHTDATLGAVTYGDPVTGTVTFQPWLIAAYTTAPTGGDISVTNASPLPDGETTVYYSENLTSSGGAGTKTWAYYGPGSLGKTPPGLSIRPAGEIYGTPTETSAGFIFGIQVKDAFQGAYKAFELPVYIGQLPVITTTSLPSGRVNHAYLENLTATGGTGTYAWSIYSGSWPHGLVLNASTGAITGTPTASGTTSFRAKVVSGGVAYKNLSITISMTPVSGNWNGTGGTEIGAYYNGTWYLDYNGNGAWNGSIIDRQYSFGSASMTPVTGDWNNDGKTEIGAYLNGTWYLDYNGNGAWNGAVIDRQYSFGSASMTPVTGDWNNDGKTEIGAYYNGTWYLDYNGNGAWNGAVIDRQYSFGSASMTPVSGNWNGTGGTEIGAYSNGTWYLDYNGNGAWNGAVIDRQYSFGNASMTPVSGNWNGTGGTEIGADLAGTWYLDYNGNGAWNGSIIDRQYSFGN